MNHAQTYYSGIVPQAESTAQRDARHAYEKAKKRRDNLCDLHIRATDLERDLNGRSCQLIAVHAQLIVSLLESRMTAEGIEDPQEEVSAYIDEKPVCHICALSDANCKCAVDDVRTDSSALAERG